MPCLARTDIDTRGGQPQTVSLEDSMSMVHGSRGIQAPRSPLMMSEPAIVAGIGNALCGSTAVAWAALADDYALIREKIEQCQRNVVDGFEQQNRKLAQPGGFHLSNAAAQRIWKTPSGKAKFKPHPIPCHGPVERARLQAGAHASELRPERILTLMTIRSHDQFNTTVYGLDDRYRGVFGGRQVIFLNAVDIARLGFADGDAVDLHGCADDGVARSVHGFQIVAYDIPPGCAAAYFPEAQASILLNYAHNR